MKTRPFFVHALSPLHAGTGQSVDIIDLPIARMRSTGMPIVPGSSVKGVLRAAMKEESDEWLAIFGPETDEAHEHAGALTVTDVHLFALPVRSFKGTFAWVTSPLLLWMARRDLQGAPKVPNVAPGHALLPKSAEAVLSQKNKVYLEEIDLDAKTDEAATAWANWVDKRAFGEDGSFSKRFAVIDDETMTFLWETATQIDARVRLDRETRTVVDGALWYEESLPPETLMLGLLVAEASKRSGVRLSADEVLDKTLPSETTAQLGGKATVGRGRCRLISIK